MASPSYYELLGVEPTADQSEVKTAFRREAKRNHPDQGGNAALFRMIEEAYATLGDANKRAAYDRSIGREPAGHARAEGDEPTGTHGATGGESAYDPGEPTGQWEQPDWADDDTWDGTNAWDHEPQEEGAPVYVARPNHSDVFADLIARVRLDYRVRRVIFWVAIAWIVIAVIAGFQAIPGVSNWAVVTTLIFGVCFWIFGSIAMRMAGWFLLILTLWNTQASGMATISTFIGIAVATSLWLGGHWWFAFRNGDWRSFLAATSLGKLPGPLDPLWRWKLREREERVNSYS